MDRQHPSPVPCHQERFTELLNALESDVRKYSEMFEAKTKAEKSGNVGKLLKLGTVFCC